LKGFDYDFSKHRTIVRDYRIKSMILNHFTVRLPIGTLPLDIVKNIYGFSVTNTVDILNVIKDHVSPEELHLENQLTTVTDNMAKYKNMYPELYNNAIDIVNMYDLESFGGPTTAEKICLKIVKEFDAYNKVAKAIHARNISFLRKFDLLI